MSSEVAPSTSAAAAAAAAASAASAADIPKHSVHTLVFRSLKRTHDMFLSDYSHPVESDDKSMELRKNVRKLAEYGQLIAMADNSKAMFDKKTSRTAAIKDSSSAPLAICMSGEDVAMGEASDSGAGEPPRSVLHMETKTPSFDKLLPSTSSESASGGAASRSSVSIFSGEGASAAGHQQFAVIKKKAMLTMPKPQWHAPWKLYRVISGHLGWVRCLDVDPSNEWFASGAGDRIIKVSRSRYPH